MLSFIVSSQFFFNKAMRYYFRCTSVASKWSDSLKISQNKLFSTQIQVISYFSFILVSCTLILALTHRKKTRTAHSHTSSGTSSQEGAPDWLVGQPALFPAGQGYWQSHLALPHQWPKPGPPASPHWLPTKEHNRQKNRDREIGQRKSPDVKDRGIEYEEDVVQEGEDKERSFQVAVTES